MFPKQQPGPHILVIVKSSRQRKHQLEFTLRWKKNTHDTECNFHFTCTVYHTHHDSQSQLLHWLSHVWGHLAQTRPQNWNFQGMWPKVLYALPSWFSGSPLFQEHCWKQQCSVFTVSAALYIFTSIWGSQRASEGVFLVICHSGN